MRNASEVVTPSAGAIVKQDFGSTAMEVRAETSATAVAAQAQAEVQARCIMAERRPRDWDVVRQKLLRECDRPGFAEVAKYAKPVGGGTIEGLSIRFAEAALRCLTNVMPQVMVVHEDLQKRIVRVSCTDLESNLTLSKDVVVEKVVERAKVREGQVVLGERTNTHGKRVYLVVASEDELATKQAAAESKALRTHVLRILPGDLADEAEARIAQTLRNRAAQDPGAERRRLFDAFGQLGIPADELKAYVGKPVEQLTPQELVQLRLVHASLKNGEASWMDLLEQKTGKAPTHSTRAPTAPAQVTVLPKKAEPVEDASAEPPPPSDADAPAEPGEDREPAAPAGEYERLAAAIRAATPEKALDPYIKQVSAMPKESPERAALGALINTRRRELRQEGAR